MATNIDLAIDVTPGAGRRTGHPLLATVVCIGVKSTNSSGVIVGKRFGPADKVWLVSDGQPGVGAEVAARIDGKQAPLDAALTNGHIGAATAVAGTNRSTVSSADEVVSVRNCLNNGGAFKQGTKISIDAVYLQTAVAQQSNAPSNGHLGPINIDLLKATVRPGQVGLGEAQSEIGGDVIWILWIVNAFDLGRRIGRRYFCRLTILHAMSSGEDGPQPDGSRGTPYFRRVTEYEGRRPFARLSRTSPDDLPAWGGASGQSIQCA